MKKPNLLIFISLLLGAFLIVTYSCKKDDTDEVGVPVVSTAEITDIGMTTAISGGEIISNGGAPIVAHGVCWSTSLTPTIADHLTTDTIGAGFFKSFVRDLLPGTTYYLRAYAINSRGIGYGSTMTFTTLLVNSGSFTDPRDGTVYQTITIGDQVWMAENLKYLPSVSPSVTGSSTTPLYYVYGYYGTDVNNAKGTSTYEHFGVLYNWSAAINSCPNGWHLPDEPEWAQLTDYLGGEFVAGGKLKIEGTTHWQSPNIGATNETGFTALPGGVRAHNQAHNVIGISGYWWSASEHSTDYAWFRMIDHNATYAASTYSFKELGCSVRCLKD